MTASVSLQLLRSKLQYGEHGLLTRRPMSEQWCIEFSSHLGPTLPISNMALDGPDRSDEGF